MKEEINRQILANDDKFSSDFDAMVLWTLHIHLGFGKRRLLRFWNAFLAEHKRLRAFYQLDPEDDGWLYKRKLKEVGVDIDALYAERKNNEENR